MSETYQRIDEKKRMQIINSAVMNMFRLRSDLFALGMMDQRESLEPLHLELRDMFINKGNENG